MVMRSYLIVGHLTFSSATVVTTNMAINGDLIVRTLNGLNVLEAARNLVQSDEDAIITGPYGVKFLGDLTGKDVYFIFYFFYKD